MLFSKENVVYETEQHIKLGKPDALLQLDRHHQFIDMRQALGETGKKESFQMLAIQLHVSGVDMTWLACIFQQVLERTKIRVVFVDCGGTTTVGFSPQTPK